eukprot:TRINITY_DN14733_c0_g1_i2.p1 TRINITY_DN14733_c0_g1~~TRINITY_DN14733_c0_g1_i2.p1  ORF type:complete len:128 (+),score=29.48 TRINITY_DN14733_c0_g1_i2:148-531(+)
MPLLTLGTPGEVCGVSALDGQNDGHVTCGLAVGDPIAELGGLRLVRPRPTSVGAAGGEAVPTKADIDETVGSAKLRLKGLILAKQMLKGKPPQFAAPVADTFYPVPDKDAPEGVVVMPTAKPRSGFL